MLNPLNKRIMNRESAPINTPPDTIKKNLIGYQLVITQIILTIIDLLYLHIIVIVSRQLTPK